MRKILKKKKGGQLPSKYPVNWKNLQALASGPITNFPLPSSFALFIHLGTEIESDKGENYQQEEKGMERGKEDT